MRWYTKQPPFYGGIDLHARTMSVYILRQDGEAGLHRHMPVKPDVWLKAIAPYRHAGEAPQGQETNPTNGDLRLKCSFTSGSHGAPIHHPFSVL